MTITELVVNMLLAAGIAFLITVIITPVLIPYLKKLKFGQQILEDGPTWHEKKSGTPTMGGIAFIIAAFVAAFAFSVATQNSEIRLMLFISIGFGVIGFLDDYIKVVKKRNQGLTAKQKFLLQAVLTVVYVLILRGMGDVNNDMKIPFIDTIVSVPLWIYIPLILFVVLGTVNAVNLTDGLDGLASSVTIVVSLFFAFAGAVMNEISGAIFASVIMGGVIAFLIFNKQPAKVFMGDTGSLFLGGALSVLAVNMQIPLVLIIVGFVYLAETLSVILQVASFKLTGKRIFKMSPIHHHFEMCGWSERKIVLVFTGVSIILAIIGVLSIMAYAV
ncbi:MAG: phospho-N-acetylmuramoyl-pentapeptide-transferase [Clostridia bacterium]|nr:phospho-N-acetylmuramoyl-pentapeptide-transferase [Clostridia bacterium]